MLYLEWRVIELMLQAYHDINTANNCEEMRLFLMWWRCDLTLHSVSHSQPLHISHLYLLYLFNLLSSFIVIWLYCAFFFLFFSLIFVSDVFNATCFVEHHCENCHSCPWGTRRNDHDRVASVCVIALTYLIVLVPHTQHCPVFPQV